MAFGFPASYSDSVELSGDRPEAREAIRSIFVLLGWPYSEADPDRFVARTGISASSFGETVTVTLEPPGIAKIESRCRFFALFDWGKNKRNVDAFIQRFSIRELRYAKSAGSPKFFDSRGKTPLDRALADPSEVAGEGEPSREMPPDPRV